MDNPQYKILFNSSGTVPTYKTSTYSIIRNYQGITDTLQSSIDAKTFGNNVFSLPFDGIVFSFVNDTTIAVNDTLTGWYVGHSNLNLAVVPDNTAPSLDVKWPTDYEMEFFDQSVGTTPYNKIPINYTLTDLKTGEPVQSEIIDNDRSKTLTLGDDIVFIQAVNKQTRYTWRIHYQPPFNPAITPEYPQAGDKFRVYTTKPFYSGDYFSFVTRASLVDNTMASNELGDISVVPNPYIATASWEPRSLYPTGRGDRKIDFVNLPAKCTIKIYTIAGALVKTLYKDSPNLTNGGSISWDLISEDGMDIAYGIYIYHVDAPGIGEHIGKFAVIK